MKIDLDISYWIHLLNVLAYKENGGKSGHSYRELKYGFEQAEKNEPKSINYENFGAKLNEDEKAIYEVQKASKIRGKTCDYVHIDDFVCVPNVKNGCTCDPDIPKSKLQEVLTDLSKEQEKRLKKAGLYKGVTKQVRKEIDERKKEIDLTWNASLKMESLKFTGTPILII